MGNAFATDYRPGTGNGNRRPGSRPTGRRSRPGTLRGIGICPDLHRSGTQAGSLIRDDSARSCLGFGTRPCRRASGAGAGPENSSLELKARVLRRAIEVARRIRSGTLHDVDGGQVVPSGPPNRCEDEPDSGVVVQHGLGDLEPVAKGPFLLEPLDSRSQEADP
jgi:hypothetical protein